MNKEYSSRTLLQICKSRQSVLKGETKNDLELQHHSQQQ